MKVKSETTYEKEDVGRILVEHHAKLFGNAPTGYGWEFRSIYGEFVVEAIETENPVEKKEATTDGN